MPPRPQSRAIRQARVPAATLRSLAVVAALAAAPAVADRAADERTIRDAAAASGKALERGDSAALAHAWTADGDIVDEFGDVLKGRDTVAVVPAAAAGAARPEVKLSETSLRFLTDDVAVEDGTVEGRLAGGEAQAGRFSATWVRADGAWSESFQPGEMTLEGLGAEQRAEILALFPELATGASFPAARLSLKAKEARVLLSA